MITELQIFSNPEFGSVRAAEINGEPWFVGKDIAERLGYSNPQKAIRDHVDEEDRGVNESFTVNGTMATLINESGVYSLILRSNLPKAKQFKHWITSEVLPSIRKTGGYIAGQETMSDEELLAKALMVAKKQIEMKDKRIADQEQKILEDHPKVIFAEAVSASDSAILVRDLAKMIRQNGVDIGERRLWSWLRENGYICKSSCIPTQRAMDMRLFVIVEHTIERGDGNPIVKATTKITGKGQQYFINKFIGDCLF